MTNESRIPANEAINFHLVYAKNNLQVASSTFHPSFTYPFLGEDEVFENVPDDYKLDFHIASGSLYTFASAQHELLCPALNVDTVNFDEFVAQLSKPWKPFGTLYSEYKIKDAEFCVYVAQSSTVNFIPYHKKLQSLAKFFIEGASYCDIDNEPQWDIYTIYKKDDYGLHLAGFITAYNFFAWPLNTKYRISQFLILPPYQRQGLGSRLYRLLYQDLAARSKVVEITVEDPNDDFQEMRDLCDVVMLIKNQAFEALVAPVNAEILEQARERFKINKRQLRRCCEIILLSRINDKTIDAYRVWVKKRIYAQNYEALEEMEESERLSKLAETYDLIVQDYRELLEKVLLAL